MMKFNILIMQVSLFYLYVLRLAHLLEKRYTQRRGEGQESSFQLREIGVHICSCIVVMPEMTASLAPEAIKVFSSFGSWASREIQRGKKPATTTSMTLG